MAKVIKRIFKSIQLVLTFLGSVRTVMKRVMLRPYEAILLRESGIFLVKKILMTMLDQKRIHTKKISGFLRTYSHWPHFKVTTSPTKVPIPHSMY